jgi:hypothetical protein
MPHVFLLISNCKVIIVSVTNHRIRYLVIICNSKPLTNGLIVSLIYTLIMNLRTYSPFRNRIVDENLSKYSFYSYIQPKET